MNNDFMPWGFIPIFICGWLAVCFILAHIGGWTKLNCYYPALSPPENAIFYTISAGMRWGTSYRSCLVLGATTQGIYVRLIFLFRPWHPPLFIPWSDITTMEQKQWFIPVIRFNFSKAPDVPLVMLKGVASKILGHRPY
jgi:hypothetical protein